MAIQSESDERFLVVQSELEPFPEWALEEIRQERMLSDEQDLEFPPCKVELVLRAKGRLYVVLPTGVQTTLPFACNAPFIQDPARLKIKDPVTSATNRWLLQRVGELASSTMLAWLRAAGTTVSERASAYDLLPDLDTTDTSFESSCASLVAQTVQRSLQGKALLLTEDGSLVAASGAVLVPPELLDVWPANQVSLHFDGLQRPTLSSKVSAKNGAKLIKWQLVGNLEKHQVLRTLQSKHLPRPETWAKLLMLWAYLTPDLLAWKYRLERGCVRIMPVQGKENLFSSNEVVRLGDKRLLQEEADWTFLAEYLLVLNQNWPRYLREQKRVAEAEGTPVRNELDLALALSNSLNVDGASDVSEVIGQVATAFFAKPDYTLAQCVQLTQLAAKLGATMSATFCYADKTQRMRRVGEGVLNDGDVPIEDLFERDWYESHSLNREYTDKFGSCTTEEWTQWVVSGRSGLLGFAPIEQVINSVFGREMVQAECVRRGGRGPFFFHYVTAQFRFEDWDFEARHWRHWQGLASNDEGLWARILDIVLGQPSTFWAKVLNARAVQISTSGSAKAITQEPLFPAWILKLRNLPCLRDTRGFIRHPSELLRRTPQTESLLDVEPFIDGFVDNEATRPLLDLLGVRSAPTGPDGLLGRLRALSASANAPAHEVDKWYRRLDSMIDHCSTSDFSKIKAALRDENIVLTQSSGWAAGSGVFLTCDDSDVPGMAVVREAVSDLTLWRKIGIAERPTADLALQWLRNLPSGEPLSQEDARRVRTLLARYPKRIWDECQHWLNLSGEWAHVDTLAYTLSMQSLVAWKHMHEAVKQATADLQPVPGDVSGAPPFSALPTLAERVEERFHGVSTACVAAEQQPWLNQLGAELQRIELDDAAEQDRVRRAAAALAAAHWKTVPGLEIIPYIDGTPAGVPRRADVVWLEGVFYVEDRPFAKLARSVAQELGREFRRADIGDAIKMCMGRSPQFILEYLEENFKLGPRPEPQQAPECTAPADSPSGDQPEPLTDVEAEPVVPGEGGLEPTTETDGNDTPPTAPETPTTSKPHPPAKPPKPSIIERFAIAQGYHKDGSDRFYHSDKSWIAKAPEMGQLWERRAGDGHLLAYYWPKDQCLELGPIQMEAEVWGLLDRSPELYSLVLADPEGNPVQMNGVRLREMCNAREVELFPASYRLARRAH